MTRPLVILLAAAAVVGPIAHAGEDDAPSLYASGYDALQEDRLDEAEQLLSSCIVVDPAYADCWWGLGLVSWKREAWSRALRQWEQVERIDPSHPHLARWLPKAREKVAALTSIGAPTAPAPEATATVTEAPTTAAAPTVDPTALASASAPPAPVAPTVTVAPTVVVATTTTAEVAPTPQGADPDGGAVLATSGVAVQELDGSAGPTVTIAPTVVATMPQAAPTVVATAPVVTTAAPTVVASVAPPVVTTVPTVVATAPTVVATAPSVVAPTIVASASPTPLEATPPAPAGFDWSGTWHFGECWTTAAGFDACIDHAVKVFPKDGALYAEYDADGYQTMTRFLCKVIASGDDVELVHVEDRTGNVFAGNPGEVVVRLHQKGGTVEAMLPGESDEKLLARKDR